MPHGCATSCLSGKAACHAVMRHQSISFSSVLLNQQGQRLRLWNGARLSDQIRQQGHRSVDRTTIRELPRRFAGGVLLVEPGSLVREELNDLADLIRRTAG